MVDGIFNIKELLSSMDKENIHADITIDEEDAKFIHDFDESKVNKLEKEEQEEVIEEMDEIDDKNIIPLEPLNHKNNLKLKMNSNNYSEDINDEINPSEITQDENLL